jgi:hypothetical protein
MTLKPLSQPRAKRVFIVVGGGAIITTLIWLLPLLAGWFEGIAQTQQATRVHQAAIENLGRNDSIQRADINFLYRQLERRQMFDSLVTQRKLNKIMRQLGLDPAID